MKTIILKLDPLTREELYADIAEELLAFIILEAVINVVNELPRPLRAMTPEEQLADCMDDTDTQLVSSVETLVSILIDHDEKNGADEQMLQHNREEFTEQVSQKLYAAMESIATSNDVSELTAINQALNAPEVANHLSFCATHLGDRVLFTLGSL